MKSQKREKLIYEDELCFITTEPLKAYLSTKISVADLKDYSVTWEVIDNKLFLIDFAATNEGKKIDLNYLFPNQEKVFANWFTGEFSIWYKINTYITYFFEKGICQKMTDDYMFLDPYCEGLKHIFKK
jgi:hypothetical protein